MVQITTSVRKLINKASKTSKYRNQKAVCLSKHNHDSKLEANYCNRLLAMKQNKEIVDYDVQQSFDLKINGIVICRHVVDFFVHICLLEFEAHDTKGMKTDVWRIKHKMFQVLYPTIKYVVVEKH